MRNFTLRKGFLESKCGTRSSFKGFVMLVVMMLMMANSAMAEVIDGLRYRLDADTKTATLLPKAGGNYSGDIIIPEKVKGNDGVEYVVTLLGASCFSDCSGLTSIIIPPFVTSLGDCCFSGCWGLTSITIPPLVTSLGLGCFSGCWGLTSITIPSSVTSLGDYCFYYCSGLTSITIPSSVTSLGYDCFSDCKNLETVYFKGKKCDSNYKDLKIPTTSIIKVPKEYLQEYKEAFGSDYQYIFAWNPDEQEKITSQLLHAPLLPFLTNPAN